MLGAAVGLAKTNHFAMVRILAQSFHQLFGKRKKQKPFAFVAANTAKKVNSAMARTRLFKTRY